jgi:TPR repeat protein
MKKHTILLATAMMLIVNLGYAADTNDAASRSYNSGRYVETFKLTLPLALKGSANEQYNLGAMYFQGQGVAQNYAEAFRWCKLAALQGHAKAQTVLASMYFTGKGVNEDHAEATKWFKLAAEQGQQAAQLALGLNYANEKDYSKAYMWLNLSAINGDKKSVLSRDVVAKIMTEAQLIEGQRLAQECLARNYKDC